MEDIKITNATWWCKHCNAFTIFDITVPNEEHCSICNGKVESYNIKDIPVDVLHTQRIKYLEYRNTIRLNQKKLNTINHKIQLTIANNKVHIVMGADEDDMEKYDDALEKLYEERNNIIDIMLGCKETDAGIVLAEESTKCTCNPYNIDRIMYLWESKGINNNDPCYCGSNKKFKKCCKK